MKLSVVICVFLFFQKAKNHEDEKKINVVLIFAKTSTKEAYTQDSGIKFLNFVEKTRVKHCANEGETSPPTAENDCQQLLKTGIFALIGYCRNVLGMTTAVASAENTTFSNDLRFKKSAENFEIHFHHPKTFKGRNGILNPLSYRPKFLTNREHSEVFKIRSKRQLPPEGPDFGSEDIDPKWDVFGILANIKFTFFGNFFNKEGKPQEGVESKVLDQLGKVTDNSFFELVKETLSSLQDCDSGFLMIIIGGDLSDICDMYSPLMQGIKHITENTDEANTLIIVTGYCPPLDKVSTTDYEFSIPVFIRGPPKACNLKTCSQLYDVPYAVKNLLSDLYGNDENCNSNSDSNYKRVKRRTKEKSKRNKSQAILASVPILICTILSFKFL